MDGYKVDLDRDELAQRIGGGLPRGALVIVEGSSGAGKSVLSQRLAYGLLTNDEEVTYVSTEFTTPSFLHQMEQLGYPVIDPFIQDQLRFVTTHPLLGHVVSTDEMMPRLLNAHRLMTQPVVIVDTFSKLAEPHLTGDGKMLDHLTRRLKQVTASGTTLILTVDPDRFEGLDTNALMTAADVRMEAIIDRVGDQVNRFIVVRKYARAANSVGDVIPFRVEPGAGFIVEIKAVA